MGLMDGINKDVTHVFNNQKSLDVEAKKLLAEATRFTRQTNQWLGLVDSFNTAFKAGFLSPLSLTHSLLSHTLSTH